MGQTTSKSSSPSPPSLKSITREVEDIRRNVRANRNSLSIEDKNELQADLAKKSIRVDSIARKSKKKDVRAAHHLISQASAELLSEPPLDFAAVESNSFINVSPAKIKPLQEVAKIDKRNGGSGGGGSLHSLREIQDKFDSMKLEADVAISNNDKTNLSFILRSVKNLATDLELIIVSDDGHKRRLERDMRSLYQKVLQAKKEVNRDNNLKYLNQQQAKENRSQGLIKIEENLDSINLENYKNPNQLDDLKLQLENYKIKTNSVDDSNREIQQLKSIVIAKIQSLLEVVDLSNVKISQSKLSLAEDGLDRFKIEVDKFAKNRSSIDYENYQKYLKQLEVYVDKIQSNANRDIEERKNRFMQEIHKTLTKLDDKAEGNSLIIVTNRSLNGFCDYWRDLKDTINPTNHTIDDLNIIKDVLWEIQSSICLKINEIDQNSNGILKVKVTMSERPISAIHRDSQSSVASLSRSTIIDSSKRKSLTTESILDQLMSMSSEIDQLTNGSTDPDEMRTGLGKCRDYLTNLQVSGFNHNMQMSKDQLLKRIDDHLNAPKPSGSIAVSEEMSILRADIRIARDKVERFTGAHRNVLYTKLEQLLDEIMERIEKLVENREENAKMCKEVENLKKILAEKSVKDPNYDRSLERIRKSESSTSSVQLRVKKATAEEMLTKIESAINDDIKNQITTFIGIENDPKFTQLDESLINNTLELDKLKFKKGTGEFDRKRKLLKEIQKCSDELDERVVQTQTLQNYENTIDKITSRIDSNTDNFDQLDEQLINLDLNLKKLQVHTVLEDMKNRCLERIRLLFYRLKHSINNDNNLYVQGTFV